MNWFINYLKYIIAVNCDCIVTLYEIKSKNSKLNINFAQFCNRSGPEHTAVVLNGKIYLPALKIVFDSRPGDNFVHFVLVYSVLLYLID